MRRTGRFVLGVLAVAVLGCKSHPELSKTNDKGSSEWKHWGGTSTMTILTINAGNKVDTPAGDKILELGVTCDGFHKLYEFQVGSSAEPDSGAVSIGFDDGSLTNKTFDVDSTQLKDRRVFSLRPSKADRTEILRQFKHASNFVFEFAPKGGKPQRSKFKLLNINTLLEQDQNCKEAVASIQ